MKKIFRDSYENFLEKNYDRLWDKLNYESPDDYFVLTWSSSYIFKTGITYWAVDPYFGSGKVIKSSAVKIKDFYSKIRFILITHNHRDHFDPEFARLISDLDIFWIMPDFMKTDAENAGINKVVFVHENDLVTQGEVEIEAYKGLHRDRDDPKIGTDALCYFIRTRGNSIFLPGDIRDYTPGKILISKSPDVMIAHVWLGRGNALNRFTEKESQEFSQFIAGFKPRSIYLAHLYETVRVPEEMWTYTHCGEVMDFLNLYLPETPVYIPKVFNKNFLPGADEFER